MGNGMVIASFRNSFSGAFSDTAILVLKAATASLGALLFWMVASWLYPAKAIGYVTTLISIILPLAAISRFGIADSLKTYIPQMDDPRRSEMLAASLSFALVTSSSFGVVLIFLFVADFALGVNLGFVGGGIGGLSPNGTGGLLALRYGAVALLALVLSSSIPIVESFLISMKEVKPPLFGMIVKYFSSLVILFLLFEIFPIPGHSFAILVSWAGGAAVSMAYLFRHLIKGLPGISFPNISLDWGILSGSSPLNFANLLINIRYPITLAISSSIVLAEWGAVAAAEFFILWRISSLGMAVPNAISTISLVYRGHEGGVMRLSGIFPSLLTFSASLISLVVLSLVLPVFGGMFDSISIYQIMPWSLVMIPSHLLMMNISDWRYNEQITPMALTAAITVSMFVVFLVYIAKEPSEIGWYWLITVTITGLAGFLHRVILSENNSQTN